MKLVEVEIVGVTPFLQHRFGEEAEQGGGTRPALVQRRDPREEAEKVCYRDKEGVLYFPGAAIGRLLREAGASHKQRGSRKSLKYVVPSSVFVLEETISFMHPETRKLLKAFEVDSRPVTIPSTKGRVMRHRPRLDAWMAKFTLRVNETKLAVETAQQLLTEGGDGIGVGDYRPEKGGPFGTFRVTLWKEKIEKASPEAAE